MKTWMRLAKDTRGVTMIEYIVIAALILIVALVAWQRLGTAVSKKTQQAADALK
jgi:Flp pilus assembly pilin Flp